MTVLVVTVLHCKTVGMEIYHQISSFDRAFLLFGKFITY